MQRRQLLKGVASLVVAERLITLNAAWAAGNKPIPPGVHKVTGEASINGKPATPGMAVRPGDTIRTGANSEIIYVIDKDAYLQRDNSTVAISGDTLKAGLRLIGGKLLAVFGKGEKRIETSTATIGIRGTGCYLEDEPDRVYFCLCYGTADITPARAPDHVETITTSYHDHPLFLNAGGDSMMANAMVKNHTDAELTLLENLVGRYPPFYGKSGYKY